MNRLFASACAAAFLVAVAAQPASAQSGAAAVRDACAKDIATHCPDVQPGGGQIAACFKQNATKLSEGCRTALKSNAAN